MNKEYSFLSVPRYNVSGNRLVAHVIKSQREFGVIHQEGAGQ